MANGEHPPCGLISTSGRTPLGFTCALHQVGFMLATGKSFTSPSRSNQRDERRKIPRQ
jgi:hypothetical protein